jgi:hypothetical protein
MVDSTGLGQAITVENDEGIIYELQLIYEDDLYLEAYKLSLTTCQEAQQSWEEALLEPNYERLSSLGMGSKDTTSLH